MPSMSSDSGWHWSKLPRPIRVIATGRFALEASSRSSCEALAVMTPPPASRTGRSDRLIAWAASLICLAWPFLGTLIARQVQANRPVAAVLLELDVRGHIDQDRPRPAGRGDVKSFVNRSGQILYVSDDGIVLGDRPRDPGGRGLLERVVADQVGPNLARDGDQRDRIHHGVGQAGDQDCTPRARWWR